MPKRAVIYSRYSNEAQNSATIDTQIQQCRKKLDQLKYDIVHIYKDEGISASDTQSHKRVDFAAMLADAEQERFDALCVFDLSRFSRQDPLIVLQTKEKLDRLGVEIILVDDTLPAYNSSDDDPDSRLWNQLLWLIKAGQNNAYIHKLSRRVRLGCRDAFAAGFWVGATPYGFQLEEVKDAKGDTRKRLVENENESQVVKLIFDRWCRGESQYQIAEWLNGQKIHPRRGGRWVQPRIADILTRKNYIGQVEWRAGGKNPETIQATCPQIIDQDTWQKAQARKDRCKADMGARALSASDRPLAGLVWCGVCGRRYVTCRLHPKDDQPRHGLRCASIGYQYTVKTAQTCENRTYVDETSLVGQAKKRLLRVFKEQGASREAYEQARSTHGAAGREMESEIGVLQGQKNVKESSLNRIYAAFERDPDLPYPKDRVLVVRAEVDDLANKIETLKMEQAKTPSLPDFDNFAGWYGKKVKEIQNLDGQALRSALQDLGVRITIRRDGEVQILSRMPVMYLNVRNPAAINVRAPNSTGEKPLKVLLETPPDADNTRLSTIPQV